MCNYLSSEKHHIWLPRVTFIKNKSDEHTSDDIYDDNGPFILSLEFDIDLVINNTCIICVYNTTINHLRRCDNQLIVSNLSMICNSIDNLICKVHSSTISNFDKLSTKTREVYIRRRIFYIFRFLF